MNATEAYATAGYKGDRMAASRLSTNVNVAQRVAELQGRAAKKAEVTLESLLTELEEARAIALAEKQSSAAVSATMGKAKLTGLLIEKREHIEDVKRDRWSPADVDKNLKNTASQDGLDVRIRMPEDPGAAGKTDAATKVKLLAGYNVGVVRPTGEKAVRAKASARPLERSLP